MIFVVSDNGASGEGGPNGSVNENKFFNGIPDDLAANLAMLDELGGPKTYNHYPTGLGDGVQHPVQDVEAVLVQRRHLRPVHRLLAGRDPRPRRGPRPVPPRHRPGSDACWTASASSSPTRCGGVTQIADPGRQHALQLRRRRHCQAPGQTQFFSMLGTRGIWHDGWKAVTTHPAIGGWGHYDQDTWELYHADDGPLRTARPGRGGARHGSPSWSACGSTRPAPTTRSRWTTARPSRSS